MNRKLTEDDIITAARTTGFCEARIEAEPFAPDKRVLALGLVIPRLMEGFDEPVIWRTRISLSGYEGVEDEALRNYVQYLDLLILRDDIFQRSAICFPSRSTGSCHTSCLSGRMKRSFSSSGCF